MMSKAIDMTQVVESVKSYEPKDGIAGPVQVSSDGPIRDAIAELIHGIHKRGFDPDECAFYMSPVVASKIHEENADGPLLTRADKYRGYPIRRHHDIPDHLIMFMSPKAASLGGKIYDPACIAFAELTEGVE